jgi:hypothetical protein
MRELFESRLHLEQKHFLPHYLQLISKQKLFTKVNKNGKREGLGEEIV